jgi:hypothetical protein
VPAETLLATAHEALAAGDWAAARSRFEAALAQEENAEALLGLGTAEWWLEERSASLRHRERAYADFRRRPDPLQAALVALGLVPHYGAALGNLAAAQGWTNRRRGSWSSSIWRRCAGGCCCAAPRSPARRTTARGPRGSPARTLEVARREGDVDPSCARSPSSAPS